MNSDKKTGIIIIIIGICIPLLVLPFLSGFSKEKGFTQNFYSVGIKIGNDRADDTMSNAEPGQKPKITWGSLMPKKIQFRFILGVTVLLLFIGFVKVERSWQKQKGDGGHEKG